MCQLVLKAFQLVRGEMLLASGSSSQKLIRWLGLETLFSAGRHHLTTCVPPTSHLCPDLHAPLQCRQGLLVFSSLSRQHLVQLHFHLVLTLPEQPAVTQWSQPHLPPCSRTWWSPLFRLTSPSVPGIASPDPASHPDIPLSSAHSLHRPSLHGGKRKVTISPFPA